MLHGLARIAVRPVRPGPRRLLDEALRLEQLAWAALCALSPADGDLYWRVKDLWLRASARRRRRESAMFTGRIAA